MKNNDEPEWMVELGRRMDAAESIDEAREIMHNDPNWIAMKAEKQEKLDRLHAERELAEKPLVKDIRSAGFDVSSVWDLNGEDEELVPLLLEHLGREYPEWVREGIGRAVGVRSMRKELWPVLADIYRNEPPESGAKEGLAASLAYMVDGRTVDELIELTDDPNNGPSRLLFLWGLNRSRQPQALEALKRYVDDPVLGEVARGYVKKKEQYRRRKAKKSS